MSLPGDDRAASVQIGAVILFGFVVVAMASWQATVVPQENARVEYTHNQRVHDDMQDVRNSIVSAAGGDSPASVSVDMGPEYPPRSVFVNPGPPSGQLETVGTENPALNLTLDNATAARDGETADFWDGSARSFNTGGLVYDPRYNVYTGAPTTIYENSVLYNRQGGTGPNVTVAGQNLIDGNRLSLVTLNGSLSESRSGAYTVDPTLLSGSTRTVTLTNSSAGNLTVTFASRLPASWWEETLADEMLANGGNVVDVRASSLPGPFRAITLELAADETYRLQMAKVGVGRNARTPGSAYLTDVAGDGASVPEDSTGELVVEVRDAYNNPRDGVEVSASVNTTAETLGGLDARANATTDEEGRVSVTLETGEVDGVSQRRVAVNVSFAVNDTDVPGFDGERPENVVLLVTVRNSDGSGLGGGGGGGSAYEIDWDRPDGLAGNPSTGVTCSDSENCVWDVGASGVTRLDMRANTSTATANLSVDFGVSRPSVAYFDPSDAETGADGAVTTELFARANGTVTAVAVSGGDTTTINVTVTNVTVGNLPPTADFDYAPASPRTNETVTFDAAASSDPEGSITSYEWDLDGDGNFDDATGATTTYAYADDGDYDVSLRVTDNGSNTDTVTKTVTVLNRPPDANLTYSPTDPSTDDIVSFDASGSVDPDGSVTSYQWEFGDGNTSSGETAAHTYASAGTYTVNLTVTDDDGLQDTASTTITVSDNQAPSASFTFSPADPNTSDTVNFDASASTDPDGTIDRYDWEFGDGDTAFGATPSHSYADNGTYTVTLTVTDDDGGTDSTTRTVQVDNVAPSATFTYSPSRPVAGDPATFDASGSGDTDGSVATYEWDWDDDGTFEDTTASPTIDHAFGSGGRYNVTLRVVDDDGATTVTNRTVQVIGGRIGVTYLVTNASGNRLRAIDRDGRVTQFAVGGNVETVGPASADLDGDGLVEATYVTSSGYIELTDRYNETQTLLNSVSAKKDAIAVGSWQGSPTQVFYANNNDQGSVFRKGLGGSGAGTKVADFGATSLKGVLGIGDVDGDGSDEIAVLTGNNYVGLVDQDGSTYVDEDQLTVAASSGPAVGPVADYNGDGDDRIATVDGSNRIRLVECNYKTTGRGSNLRCNAGAGTAQETVTLTPSAGAKKAPFGAADWTGDATPELVYAENANSPAELYYVEVTGADGVGAEGYVTTVGGSRIQPVVPGGIGGSARLEPGPSSVAAAGETAARSAVPPRRADGWTPLDVRHSS